MATPLSLPLASAAELRAVNEVECARIREMATREPYLAGALSRLCRGVSVSEMTFPIDGLSDLPEHLRRAVGKRVVDEYWAPLALEYVRSRLMFGFFAYQLTKRRVVARDGNVRLALISSRKRDRNRKRQRGIGGFIGGGDEDGAADAAAAAADADASDDDGSESSAGAEFHVVVPTIPDPSTYRTFVGLNAQREAYIVCVPTNDDRFEKSAIRVVCTDYKYAPDPITGNLRSPLSSLISSYAAYEQYDQCELQAAYASANPPVVYQEVPRKDMDPASSGIEVDTGMAALTMGSVDPIEERVNLFSHMTDLAQEQIRADSERNAAMAERMRAGLMNDKTVMLHDTLTAGRRHFLPMNKMLAPNVPTPEAPQNLWKRFDAYRSLVSVALGVPSAYLGQIASGRNVAQFAEIETSDFVETLSSTAKDAERAMAEVYYDALDRRIGVFKIPIFAMQTVDRLREIYALGAIDHATLRANIFRVTGVQVASSDTRRTEMPPEGYIAAKRVELEEERLELEKMKTEEGVELTRAQVKATKVQADVAAKTAAAAAATKPASSSSAQRHSNLA